jgi:hypothetical protein
MLAIAEPKARLKLVWTRPRRALRTAASPSGISTSRAISAPTADWAAPTASTASSIGEDSSLARPNGDQGEQQQAEAAQRLAVAGRLRVAFAAARLDRQEVVAVADRLHEDEEPVEGD